MDIELLDLIARTRPTIVEILKNRGYNVKAYENESPADLVALATNASNLQIKAEKVEDGPAPMKQCVVLYWIESAVRSKLQKQELEKLWDTEMNPDAYNPAETELILLLAEPFHEVFHIQAAKLWGKRKARVSFFHIKQLVSNPSKHAFVPPHRKLTEEEITQVMERWSLKSKSEFSRILYHIDIQARVLGLVPGDVVEIRRPSPTTGEYVLYRVCTIS
jgi:DNA-directed RNA polymerase subunit H (RpoH/RPB5)